MIRLESEYRLAGSIKVHALYYFLIEFGWLLEEVQKRGDDANEENNVAHHLAKETRIQCRTDRYQ